MDAQAIQTVRTKLAEQIQQVIVGHEHAIEDWARVLKEVYGQTATGVWLQASNDRAVLRDNIVHGKDFTDSLA